MSTASSFVAYMKVGDLERRQLDKQYFRVKDEVLIPFVKKEVSVDALQEVLVVARTRAIL